MSVKHSGTKLRVIPSKGVVWRKRLYVAVHTHKEGVTLHHFWWNDAPRNPAVYADEIARQLSINYERDRDETLEFEDAGFGGWPVLTRKPVSLEDLLPAPDALTTAQGAAAL